MNVRLLTTFFRAFPNITDLQLSLSEDNATYLDPLARALSSLALQTLVLSDITAQFTQLAPLLDSSLHPLWRFELSHSHFSEYADFKQLLDFLLCMPELQSCTLDRLNFAQNSLRLGKLNELRPTTVDEAHWVMVYWHRYSRIQCQSQIAIHADEGDDIRYWLRQTMQHATFGRPWLL